jgi:hypothetical protein
MTIIKVVIVIEAEDMAINLIEEEEQGEEVEQELEAEDIRIDMMRIDISNRN